MPKAVDMTTAALILISEIRVAAGDPEGRLMQDELVEHVRDLNARLKRAEPILERLATGYLGHVLDEATPGENLGQQVLEYWKAAAK